MSATIQSGMHPDAESLTAFAEQLLPAAERGQILAHMATCGRCREVVFLAQHAVSEDQPEMVAGSAATPTKKRKSRFNGWKWMWIPATAFAGLIGVAVVQHSRHAASETEMTAKLSSTDALRNVEPAKAPATSPESTIHPAPELQKEQTVKSSKDQDKVRDGAPLQEEKDEAKQLDEKKSAERRDLAVGSAGAPTVIPPSVSMGSIHGMTAARAKSSPFDGPSAANQLQQQNMMTQQNVPQQTQSVQVDAANSLVVSGAAPRAPVQSVDARPEVDSVKPVPAPATQLTTIPVTGQNYEVSSANMAKLSKAKASLPNGMDALSVATVASRTVALDTKGALYLSEDGGKHWQPIQSQWSGRAVLVRGAPVSPPAAAMQTAPQSRFELVNEKLQTWFSFDGKIWTPEPLPAK